MASIEMSLFDLNIPMFYFEERNRDLQTIQTHLSIDIPWESSCSILNDTASRTIRNTGIRRRKDKLVFVWFNTNFSGTKLLHTEAHPTSLGEDSYAREKASKLNFCSRVYPLSHTPFFFL